MDKTQKQKHKHKNKKKTETQSHRECHFKQLTFPSLGRIDD